MGKFFAQLHRVYLADQDLAPLRYRDSGQRRDGRRRLSDDLCVQRAVDQDRFADLVQLVSFQEVAASCRELAPHGVIDLRMDDHGLLRGTDHAVVEGLGVNDGVDGQQNIRRLVDDRRRVSRADTQRRSAGGIGRVDHVRAAGGENDVRFLHQHARHVTRRHVDPADDVFRCAGRYGRFQDDLRRLHRAGLRPVMRADDDAVACLQRQKRLEDGGGSRVCRRNNRADQTQGLGNLPHAVFLVFFNHAAGSGVPIGVVDIFGREVILDHLVFHDSHSGLRHCGLGQWNTCLVGRGRRRQKDSVHLLL